MVPQVNDIETVLSLSLSGFVRLSHFFALLLSNVFVFVFRL